MADVDHARGPTGIEMGEAVSRFGWSNAIHTVRSVNMKWTLSSTASCGVSAGTRMRALARASGVRSPELVQGSGARRGPWTSRRQRAGQNVSRGLAEAGSSASSVPG
jgi:hypothetical protein